LGWLRPLFGLKSEVAEPAVPIRASGQAAS